MEELGDVGRVVVTAPGAVVGDVVDALDGMPEVPVAVPVTERPPVVEDGRAVWTPAPGPPPVEEHAATRPSGSMASTARRRTVGTSSPELTHPTYGADLGLS